MSFPYIENEAKFFCESFALLFSIDFWIDGPKWCLSNCRSDCFRGSHSTFCLQVKHVTSKNCICLVFFSSIYVMQLGFILGFYNFSLASLEFPASVSCKFLIPFLIFFLHYVLIVSHNYLSLGIFHLELNLYIWLQVAYGFQRFTFVSSCPQAVPNSHLSGF